MRAALCHLTFVETTCLQASSVVTLLAEAPFSEQLRCQDRKYHQNKTKRPRGYFLRNKRLQNYQLSQQMHVAV